MIGEILVWTAAGSCMLAVLAYFFHHQFGLPLFLRSGRWAFIIAASAVVGAAAFLLHLILTHQFQYTYVWSYSSRELPTPLLISTFYAGQEGSFMLWTLYTSLIGLLLMRYTAKMKYEAEVMCVYGLMLLMLLVMLLLKSPFRMVWESWAGEVQAGFVPANGRGLNPLLQNYWMVIHPQVLFSGFAAMGVPYAFAVAALMKRDYQHWIKPATPWMVFALLVLGTGIMMGGLWAYETLGWGGYWGWDPVENSSLVPWLVCLAGVHTILSQRKNGGFVRTNLILGMLAFLMVLYSTFLTRSGVLGETSVHSFVDPGMVVYWFLIAIIVLFFAIGLGLLLTRWKEIPRARIPHTLSSREFALFLGATTLVAVALLVTLGTSSPLVTDILNGKKTAVDIEYYVRTVPPLGVVIGVLAGLGQLLWWTRSDRKELFRVLRIPVVLAVLMSLTLVGAGVRGVTGILFVLGSSFALFANIQVALQIFRGNPRFIGGAIAHIGVAIMFLGFLGSSQYDVKQTVSLVQGSPVESMGYKLTYVGYRPLENEKYAFQVNVEKGDRRYQVAPVMYHSTYNDGLMRHPDVLNLLTSDFYLAPLSLEQPGQDSAAAMERARFHIGETTSIGGLTVTFLGFHLPEMHQAEMIEGKEIRIGARFSVARNGSSARTVEPAKFIKGGETRDEEGVFEGRYHFLITALSPDREVRQNSTVEIGVVDQLAGGAGNRTPDILVAEASIKPYINLVWAGAVLVLLGFVVTIIRRGREASLRKPPAQEAVS
jgi:cytochrome c-type biogenesis protein CcmF